MSVSVNVRVDGGTGGTTAVSASAMAMKLWTWLIVVVLARPVNQKGAEISQDLGEDPLVIALASIGPHSRAL